jgi:cytochrome c biogenesis protein CcmG/thiol:disulfide interchange protein DsbE
MDGTGTDPTPPPRGRRSRLIAPLVAVAVALVAALLIARAGSGSSPSGTRGPDTGTHVQVSLEPTSWELPRLDGPGVVRLADFRGHPVVLNFFASWCVPCRAELPVLSAMAAQAGDRVRFVGVDSEENGDGRALAHQDVPGWPLAQDVGGRLNSGLHDALGAQGMPVTAFYDAQGRLLGVKLCTFVHDTLRDRLNQLYGLGVS